MAEQTAIRGSCNLQSHCHSDRYGSTPPENALHLPLTPPASDEGHQLLSAASVRVMRAFQACHDPTATKPLPLLKFKITPQEYSQLMKALEHDQPLWGFVEDKVRFDYEPEPGILTFRMPTALHDFFSSFITLEIIEQLKRIADRGGVAGEFASKIAAGGTSRIFLREGFSDERSEVSVGPVKREPDGQFHHKNATYPGVVLEVSYTDHKNLKKLASDYILQSNGDIKAVIGFDVNRHGKESTVSLWRPKYTRENGEELDILGVEEKIAYKPFRSAEGSSVHNEYLSLNLSDFATDEISSGHESVSLSISFERLANLLAEAEEMQQIRESGDGRIKSRRQTRRRIPSSSSAEELRSEDEARYQEQERHATERCAAEDGDFPNPAAKRRG